MDALEEGRRPIREMFAESSLALISLFVPLSIQDAATYGLGRIRRVGELLSTLAKTAGTLPAHTLSFAEDVSERIKALRISNSRPVAGSSEYYHHSDNVIEGPEGRFIRDKDENFEGQAVYRDESGDRYIFEPDGRRVVSSKISVDEAIRGLCKINGIEANKFARRIAEVTTHVNQNSNRVVLGKWAENGGYIGEEKSNGGVWYETDSSFFAKLTNGLGETEGRVKAWAVNEQFLLSQLERGVARIDLHGKTMREVLNNRPNSFTAMEIKYLKTNASNFGFVKVGNSWIKAD